MRAIFRYLKQKPLTVLIIALPFVLLADWLNWGTIYVFIFSAVGLIPLAGLIGEGTENLAAYTGPKIGGLLNATLGNAAELIITLVAVQAGLLELVKASITGSIIGNLLLVLGASMLAGGIKNGIQRFDQRQSGNHAVLLTLAIVALVIPSLFGHSIGPDDSIEVEALSLGVAVVMIVLYLLGLIYSLKAAHSPLTIVPSENNVKAPHLSKTQAFLMLLAATIGVVYLSEKLVGSVEEVMISWGVSEFFLGIILIPLIGNVAEHLVAVTVAIRNQMDLSVEIAVSSSIQIALFVAPVLVFVSLAMGHPLTLMFNQFELLALGGGILIAAQVSSDGESNWLEGGALMAVYVILAIAFFLLPS